MSKTTLDPKHFDSLRRFKAGVFKVLGHPTRIHVIETLREGELSVGAVLEKVKVEPANLSQHLSLLRQSHPTPLKPTAKAIADRLRQTYFHFNIIPGSG